MKQIDIVLHLKEKGAYSHRVSTVRVLETHISWIFLTGKYVYKVKKETKFGRILDFSSLRLRKHFCKKEVMLNRPLCGKMYQGIVKVVKTDDNIEVTRYILPYDVIILDYKMPKANAVEVANNILSLNPRQRIVIATADIHDAVNEFPNKIEW